MPNKVYYAELDNNTYVAVLSFKLNIASDTKQSKLIIRKA